jgi:hypothetical protein
MAPLYSMCRQKKLRVVGFSRHATAAALNGVRVAGKAGPSTDHNHKSGTNRYSTGPSSAKGDHTPGDD